MMMISAEAAKCRLTCWCFSREGPLQDR